MAAGSIPPAAVARGIVVAGAEPSKTEEHNTRSLVLAAEQSPGKQVAELRSNIHDPTLAFA